MNCCNALKQLLKRTTHSATLDRAVCPRRRAADLVAGQLLQLRHGADDNRLLAVLADPQRDGRPPEPRAADRPVVRILHCATKRVIMPLPPDQHSAGD